MLMRIAALAAVCFAVVACAASPAASRPAAHEAFRLPHLRHVWVIELENKGYAQSFGNPASDPYLAQTCAMTGTTRHA